MSLIDEALKRAELEAARRDGLRGGAYPWVPEHHTKRRRPWALVAAVVISAGIVAGGVMWLSRRPAPVQSSESKVQGLRSKVQGPPSPEFQTIEVAPPPRSLPSKAPAEEREIASSKGREEPKRSAPKPPADAARVRTAPDGAKIELGGIVFSETNPVALINGKVLGPGATVEEFTIVSIQPDRVELRGRGITMFLALK
jgi:hypothetical protein